jgi:hypothetical protein
MNPFFTHRPPTPEPNEEPIPDDEPEPGDDPTPHPDPVAAPVVPLARHLSHGKMRLISTSLLHAPPMHAGRQRC